MKTILTHWFRKISSPALGLFLFLLAATAGCVSKSSTQGVENLWRAEPPPVFQVGKSTEHDVLSTLGPPSQVISLGNRTVFYYLIEAKRSGTIILIIYNQTRERITYDRAIFFFDAQGRLTDFTTSNEKVPLQ
jgi:outer membrane protein assembly factor BamE (lipoprotein component of BamABCDE complex)